MAGGVSAARKADVIPASAPVRSPIAGAVSVTTGLSVVVHPRALETADTVMTASDAVIMCATPG